MSRLLALGLVVVAGCGSRGAAGTLRIAASGEQAAVDGYPSSTGVAFVDGWTLAFDFVLVSLDALYVRRGGTGPTLEADAVVVALHDAVRQDVWTFPALPAQRYEDVGYEIAAPTASSRPIGSVTDVQIATMVAGGVTYWLHGTAHHPDHHDVVLDLRIPTHTAMSRCTSATDMARGLVVTPSGTADHTVTFHLDHVFFDSVVLPEPHLRFEAYAAAAGGDFVVTWDELASQPLANLHDIDGSPLTEGGRQIFYDPGSTPLAVQDLRSFVYHQATTLGHFDGDGHCDYVCVDASGTAQPGCPAPAR